MSFCVFHTTAKGRTEVRLVDGSGRPRVFASDIEARCAISRCLQATTPERLLNLLPAYESGALSFDEIFECMWIEEVEADDDGFVYTECGDKYPRDQEHASKI